MIIWINQIFTLFPPFKSNAKIHEGMLSDQLCEYVYGIFADRVFGHRKKHRCKAKRLNMVKQWKHAMGKGEYFGAVLIDLSKAFDCLRHRLLIAKLKAQELLPSAYRLLASYLHGSHQVGNTRSIWALHRGQWWVVVYCSICFFIFHVVDNGSLFSHADDNMASRRYVNLQSLVATLVNDIQLLITWFPNNGTSANPNKLRVPLLCPDQGEVLRNPLCVDADAIKPGTCVTVLGVTTDENLILKATLMKYARKPRSRRTHCVE